MFYLLQSTSPLFENLSLAEWQQKDNIIYVTWFGVINNETKVCDFEALKNVWRMMTSDTGLIKLVYYHQAEVKYGFSKYFRPEFSVIQNRVLFNEHCTKQKLLKTLAYKFPVPKTKNLVSKKDKTPEVLLTYPWNIEVEMGIMTVVDIIESFFISSTPLTYKLVAENDQKIPRWLQLDGKQIVILAFSTDFEKTVNYKGVWRGGLVAISNGLESEPLKIKIIANKNNYYYESQVIYRTEMRLSRKNFKVSFVNLLQYI